MKIISDNPELLDAIHTKLKLARIEVKKETKTVDGAMADELTTVLEILNQLKNNYKDIAFYIGSVVATGKYLKSTIKVELKDGTLISYAEYEKMSDEELQKVFSK